MAESSDFQIKTRLEWKTALPISDARGIRSPKFSLRGSEWYLSLCAREFYYNVSYNVSLVPARNHPRGGESGKVFRNPFIVMTSMKDPNDASRFPGEWRSCKIHKLAEKSIWRVRQMRGTIEPCLDKMQFLCKFYGVDVFQKKPKKRCHQSVQVSSEVPRDIETFTSDFSHMLEDEILSDVKLECGNRVFQVHRSVLAARSQVFRAMFRNGERIGKGEWLESESGTVKIPDVDEEVLEKLLKYVYTGKPEDISEGTAADLYGAADKYDVDSLKTACVYWIERHLTAENCVVYLAIADSHSDRDLKATVMSFILESPNLLKSEAWVAFSKEHSKLAIEVFQAYVAATVQ